MSGEKNTILTTEKIRKLPFLQRIPFVKYIRVLYPRANEILDQLRYCMKASSFSVEPKCKLIVGPSGVGKTTIVTSFMEEYPRSYTKTGTNVPVFMVTVDSPATVGSLASRLLQGIGDPRFDKGNIVNRIVRVENFVEKCNCEMIIIDEIQHFVDRDSKKILQEVSDALKNLVKTKHLSCILAGLDGEAEQVVNSNLQLARLFSDPIRLKPFSWSERHPETIREFRKLLFELGKVIPLNNTSNFNSLDFARRMFEATDGLMAFIMVLIREGTVLALERGMEYLDTRILAEIFDEELAKDRRDICNPFVD